MKLSDSVKFIIICGVFLVAVALVIAYNTSIFSLKTSLNCTTGSTSVTPVSAYFFKEVENIILKTSGSQQIEGLLPLMIKKSLPGLELSDFECVEANNGHYRLKNNKLVFVKNKISNVHSSANQSISPNGMGRLLENISKRLNVLVETNDDVDVILKSVGNSNDASSIPKDITISGTYVCLPHINTAGPQTMECAYGLLTSEGKYYGLDLQKLIPSIPTITIGEKVSVTGLFVKLEALSTDFWQKYPIEGIISVTSVPKKL